jgi:hyperosmotically inducible protein
VLALAAALLAIGCASTDTRRASGQVIDDASITARVKTALAKESGIGGSMDINVNTYNGMVQLSGFVPAREVANRAGEAARGVPGVQSVRNDIQVVTPRADASAGSGAPSTTRSAGQVTEDASITARVKAALAKQAGFGSAMDINVNTYQGTVQLSGFVPSRDAVDRAGEAARSVQGVQSVKNDIIVASQRPASSAGPGRSGSGAIQSGY